jgi:hypothetical protein
MFFRNRKDSAVLPVGKTTESLYSGILLQNFYTLSTAITAFSPLIFHSFDTLYSAPLVSSSARTLPLMWAD